MTDDALRETMPRNWTDVFGEGLEYMFGGMASGMAMGTSQQAIFQSDRELIESNLSSLQLRRDRLEQFEKSPEVQRQIELIDRVVKEIGKVSENLGIAAEKAGRVTDSLEKGSNAANNLAKQRGAQGVSRE